MTFKKGGIPWNYHPPTYNDCLICGKKIRTKPCLIKRGFTKYCSMKRYGVSKIGKKPTNIKSLSAYLKSDEHRRLVSIRFKNQTPWNKNKELPQYSKEKHPNWRGGKTAIRKTAQYGKWRRAVLKRDSYTCIWCGSKEDLEVDHIKSFALCPELRFELDNGRTLCHSCHKKTNSYAKSWVANKYTSLPMHI